MAVERLNWGARRGSSSPQAAQPWAGLLKARKRGRERCQGGRRRRKHVLGNVYYDERRAILLHAGLMCGRVAMASRERLDGGGQGLGWIQLAVTGSETDT